MLLRAIDRFFRHEAFGGLLLMASAVAALVVANSALALLYDAFLDARVSLTVNGEGLSKPAILWINDGLMAIFFFLIGLELKRELREGKLRNPRDVALPGVAAIGGMALPALVFAAINAGLPTLSGWAIPAATDIAFALGLIVGKQAGIMGAVWLMVRGGLAPLPRGAGWLHVYGIACLAGIGFTMSLFIGGLSFADPALMNEVRLGVLAGSLVSGLMGYGALMLAAPAPRGGAAPV